MRNTYYTLITGASEGFGKALAIECASRNMNLVLVALPGHELHSLTDFIKRNYYVDVISIEKDLCRDESCSELFNEVNALGLQVNMLINNAGIGSTMMFEKGSVYQYEKQIKLNVLATTIITRLFLENLKQNSPSYILNVGSMACFFSLPRKQVYGATKSFIYSFSKSLRKELLKDNVHVCVLCPGGMNTNLAVTLMNKTANFISRLSVMNPEDVAPVAIDALLKGKEVIIPGRLNKLFMLFNWLLPNWLKKIISNKSIGKLDPDNSLIRYLYPNPDTVATKRAII